MAFLVMAMIALLFCVITNKTMKEGSDFYVSLLLAFLMSGVGIAYLVERKKGTWWLLIQIIAFVTCGLLPHIIGIESKYLGLIIIAPFIMQLIETVIVYKSKHGDIEF